MPRISRRDFACAALAAAASPYILTSAQAASSAAGPVDKTAGPIAVGAGVTGYTVDSIRHHSINTYWIEGREGTIAIDALWRIPEAEEAMGAFQGITGRPADTIGVIAITHPHSDHYGGLTTYRAAAGGAPAVATQAVQRVIRNDEHGFYANRLQDIPEDIPPEIPIPSVGLQDGTPLTAAGATLETHILRDNEAIETALLYHAASGTLFTGDVVNHKTTPVLYQGGLDPWIEQLKGLRTRFPDARVIAPGHGTPGDFDILVGDELAYLEFFRQQMEDELDRGGGFIGPEAETRIAIAVAEAFPDWRTSAGVPSRDALIRLNIGFTLRGWRLQAGGDASPEEFRPDNG